MILSNIVLSVTIISVGILSFIYGGYEGKE
jgi:hypothetical protein